MTPRRAIEIVNDAFNGWYSEYGGIDEDWSEEFAAWGMAVEALEKMAEHTRPIAAHVTCQCCQWSKLLDSDYPCRVCKNYDHWEERLNR